MLTAALLTEAYGIRIDVDHDPLTGSAHPPGRAPPAHRPCRTKSPTTSRARACLGTLIGTLLAMLLACGPPSRRHAPARLARPTTTLAPGPLTMAEPRGEELTLLGPAPTVVGLEWGETETRRRSA